MKTNLTQNRTRTQAGYVVRNIGGIQPLPSGAASLTSGTGTARHNTTAGNASSGALSVFIAALCFSVWGILTLGLSFVAVAVIGIVALFELAVKQARQMWGVHRVCAWCKCSMGGNPFAKKTHGICPTCKEIQMSRIANLNSDLLRRAGMILLVSSLISHLSAAPISHLPSPIPQAQAVRAIVGEAANQGRDGMLAVAGAIRNRGTLKGVYGVKNPIADKQPAYVWQRAQLAWAMSATNDISRGATHWENIKAFGEPRWARSLTVTTNIGSHTFYK